MTFALNHMAYFVMTEALRERLAASAPARIVSTSSTAHHGVSLDFADLQGERRYSGWRAYGRSKLANILFTRELARRLAGTGSPPTASIRASSRPGSATRRADWTSPLSCPLGRGGSPSRRDAGADTLVYLASSPEVAERDRRYFVKRKDRGALGGRAHDAREAAAERGRARGEAGSAVPAGLSAAAAKACA